MVNFQAQVRYLHCAPFFMFATATYCMDFLLCKALKRSAPCLTGVTIHTNLIEGSLRLNHELAKGKEISGKFIGKFGRNWKNTRNNLLLFHVVYNFRLFVIQCNIHTYRFCKKNVMCL